MKGSIDEVMLDERDRPKSVFYSAKESGYGFLTGLAENPSKLFDLTESDFNQPDEEEHAIQYVIMIYYNN